MNEVHHLTELQLHCEIRNIYFSLFESDSQIVVASDKALWFVEVNNV